VFDILNSRSPIAKGFKGPISKDNFAEPFLRETQAYLLSLKMPDGKPLSTTRRLNLKT
jgi:hypothetical protein